MTNSKKKANRVGKFLFLMIVLIIIAYAVHISFFMVKTMVLSEIKLENTLNTQALVIRNEKTTAIPKGANIKYYVQEGERTAVHNRVIEVLSYDSKDVDLSVQISELESQIQKIKTEGGDTNIFQNDQEKLDESIFKKTIEIKTYIKNEDFNMIKKAKGELSRYLYKKSLINKDGSFFGSNLAALEKKKAELEEIYKTNYKTIYSTASGIVGYEVDGLESIITPDKIENMTIDDLNTFIGNSSQIEKEIGIKIVDDYKWYISCGVDTSFTEGLATGKKLNVRFNNLSKDKIPCTVYNISESKNNKCVLTLQFKQQINNFQSIRLENVDIIKGVYSGYKVLSDAIVEKNGQKGIMVSRYHIARFIPVTILTELEDNYLIIADVEDRPEALDEYGTLKLYDEVVITPGFVKEDKPIN